MNNSDLNTILKGCKNQQQVFQKQLYNYCFSSMMKVCLRYHINMDEAAASYNEAMLKVFKNIEQYRGEGDLLGWVRRIMVNTCLTAIKRNARFEYDELKDITEVEHLKPEVYETIDAKDILQLVQELPETNRLVFNLFVMEGYSHDEIAALLKIPAGTSKWCLHEAKKQLKEKIKSFYKHEINSDAI